MFENIVHKIKVTAKVFWWVGTITIVGIISMWPMAFLMYGFAELIEKQTEIANHLKNLSKKKDIWLTNKEKRDIIK